MNKKGFTLIELLAVIIILAVVALIATPLILVVIDNARKSANRSQVELILDGATQIYTQSYLNDNYKKLLTNTNIYGNDNFKFSGELPEVGVVQIKPNGEIYLAVEIDGICYTKDYTQDKISESKVVEGETCVPLTVVVSSDNPNLTTWYNADVDVTLTTNGDSLKYCTVHSTAANVTLENCTPDTLVSSTTHNLLVSEEGKTKLCVLAIKGGSESSDIICAEYRVDKTLPAIVAKSEAITIKQGDDMDLSTYFDTTYGPSGGNIVCMPASALNLTVGDHTVECAATSLSGLTNTVYKDIVIELSLTKLTDYITDSVGTTGLVEENGIRYEGDNPNNYIIFNDEEWRIIGLFDTTLADGSSEKLVKIIKSTPLDYNNDNVFDLNRDGIDTQSWNSSVSNNWATSSLNNSLNNDYLFSTGTFLNNGITTEYRNLIQEVTWNLGGVSSAAIADSFYEQEHLDIRPTGQPAKINGKVGLMYASDYLYAVSSNVCSRELTSREYETAACHEQNWLFILDDYEGSSKYEWLISSYASHHYLAWNIDSKGFLHYNHVGHSQIVRPTVYISSDIIISKGAGTKANPFKIN